MPDFILLIWNAVEASQSRTEAPRTVVGGKQWEHGGKASVTSDTDPLAEEKASQHGPYKRTRNART